MPTLLRSGPYRLFVYSADRDEPPHVHVERDHCEAKIWLTPVLFERSYGFSRKELSTIMGVVEEHQQHLLEQWHGFFGG